MECQLHISRQNWTFAHLTASCLHISSFFFFFFYRFAHLRAPCFHKCGWSLMKTMICTFVGCFHISCQNFTFAHLTASCLHISGLMYFFFFFFTDLHIWGHRVCTNVVVCTFLRAKCLHKCGCLHIWGRNVCTIVVVCTYVVFALFTVALGRTTVFSPSHSGDFFWILGY